MRSRAVQLGAFSFAFGLFGWALGRVSRARDALALILAEGDLDQDTTPAHLAMPALMAEISSLRGHAA